MYRKNIWGGMQMLYRHGKAAIDTGRSVLDKTDKVVDVARQVYPFLAPAVAAIAGPSGPAVSAGVYAALNGYDQLRKKTMLLGL